MGEIPGPNPEDQDNAALNPDAAREMPVINLGSEAKPGEVPAVTQEDLNKRAAEKKDEARVMPAITQEMLEAYKAQQKKE